MSPSVRAPYLSAFVCFWTISFIFYFRTAGAGFAGDTIGWIQLHEQTGWRGIFHAFGDKSLHYVYHFLFFTLWKSFGLNGYAWMIVFVTLHAAIGTVSFNIFNILF